VPRKIKGSKRGRSGEKRKKKKKEYSGGKEEGERGGEVRGIIIRGGPSGKQNCG